MSIWRSLSLHTSLNTGPSLCCHDTWSDISGSQTLNYLPYGEDWIDVRNNLDPRLGQYTFNGKEKDYESGFHYYGARYYWSEVLTGWLSVDPMMDKYPGISPYNYCMWNPVNLMDPDGMDTILSFACKTADADVNQKNKRLLRGLRNIGDGPNVLAIGMHGFPKGVWTSTGNGEVSKVLTAKQLADRIERMTDGSTLYQDNLQKDKMTIIVLYACNTGQGDDCFGQQLSKELKSSIVIAPEGAVWVKINNEGKTTIDNAVNLGDAKNPKKGKHCVWNVFYNGKKVMSFSHSAPQAWINKQGGTNKVIERVKNENE